ncbi:hypothetical protein Scep_007509 [Stephania cephalantha]|uniref:Uncharacterized protein n=1 Tax=Stephania cephalantha TaxID=152367 RepID=A0AAP0KA80_9MAGN
MEESEGFNQVEEMHNESFVNQESTISHFWRFRSDSQFVNKSTDKSVKHGTSFPRIWPAI